MKSLHFADDLLFIRERDGQRMVLPLISEVQELKVMCGRVAAIDAATMLEEFLTTIDDPVPALLHLIQCQNVVAVMSEPS